MSIIATLAVLIGVTLAMAVLGVLLAPSQHGDGEGF
jgi:hypothetical protein